MTPLIRGLSLAVAASGALLARPAAAQAARPLNASARQDLRFGTLLPGLITTVNCLDAGAAGQFDLRGTSDAEVRIDFTLPSALSGPGGATLPLTFGAVDGAHAGQPSMGATVPFDPRLPLVTRLSRSGRLYLWLGGTATPSTTQTSGPYTSSITVTVAYTGV